MLRLEAEVLEHRRRFEEDPRDVSRAKTYWKALGQILGCDIRSGRYVAEAFGPSALASTEGAIAFARAYQELCALSGEAPKAEYIGPDLVRALSEAKNRAPPDDIEVIDWVLHCATNG